jgi:hypothetical protein
MNEAPGPETRRSTGTLARSPWPGVARGLSLAEATAYQSEGSAMSSKRSMGGKMERMIR